MLFYINISIDSFFCRLNDLKFFRHNLHNACMLQPHWVRRVTAFTWNSVFVFVCLAFDIWTKKTWILYLSDCHSCYTWHSLLITVIFILFMLILLAASEGTTIWTIRRFLLMGFCWLFLALYTKPSMRRLVVIIVLQNFRSKRYQEEEKKMTAMKNKLSKWKYYSIHHHCIHWFSIIYSLDSFVGFRSLNSVEFVAFVRVAVLNLNCSLFIAPHFVVLQSVIKFKRMQHFFSAELPHWDVDT